jgi:hypothetical protein
MTATIVGRSWEGRCGCRKQSMEIAQIQLQIHYVIKPQAGQKETKHLSKDNPYCHNITHDDHDDDNHLNNLPDTSFLKKNPFGKCLHSLTSWWVHSVMISVYKSRLFLYTGVLTSP